MVKLTNGVYVALREENFGIPADANSTIIVNDADVIVVDSNLTPASAKAVLAEIRKLTDKPVRYVINTHAHSDHIYGNQVYQEAFPQVEFIAHTEMRDEFVKRIPNGLKDFVENSRKSLADSPAQLESGKKANGEAMNEQEKAALTRRLQMLKNYLPEFETIRPIQPTMVVEKELTLFRGNRQIKLLYLGRGNTQGDLVVYLPQEKIVISGDLLVHPIPFAFESFNQEWVLTLKKLGQLDAEIIVPGHGAIQRNKEYLNLVTNFLESAVKQTNEAVKRGLTLEETRKSIDLESFRLKFAGDNPTYNRAFNNSLLNPVIERSYREAKGENIIPY